MNNMTRASATFDQFFQLAPALLSLDKELDSVGCPIAYRKHVGATLLANPTFSTEAVQCLSKMLAVKGLAAAVVLSAWYNNVYGHVVYQPPASRFLVAAVPVPIVATWDASARSVLLPDITLIKFEIQDELNKCLNPNSSLLSGLKALQALPAAPWVWLAMADFDISVACFEHPRPAYHLSLWHTQQTLEKLLKAMLLAHGETEEQIRKIGHDLDKVLNAVALRVVSLSTDGVAHVHEVFKLVGGPSIRYLSDSPDPATRIDLAQRALQAHHLTLRFLAADGDTIGAFLAPRIGRYRILGVNITADATDTTDAELRKAVQLEHQSMCSHELYTAPPYAIRERRNVALPITDFGDSNVG
jgi:HEPN domain-containing protein